MILVLNGSPNKDGYTTKVIKEQIKEEYIEIRAYDEVIKPCDDCKYCKYQTGCKWDDMDHIYELLSKCDKLVIASPLYFGALSSELLGIITRFQTYFSQKYYRELDLFTIDESLLIITAGGSYPDMFDGPRATMRLLNALFGVKKTEEVLIKSTDNEFE